MKKILLIAIIATALTSCMTSDNDFEKGKAQLEQQGYTNIENIGYQLFCCGRDDGFSTGFSCKDKNGNTVTGCFCSALGKGITIRFE